MAVLRSPAGGCSRHDISVFLGWAYSTWTAILELSSRRSEERTRREVSSMKQSRGKLYAHIRVLRADILIIGWIETLIFGWKMFNHDLGLYFRRTYHSVRWARPSASQINIHSNQFRKQFHVNHLIIALCWRWAASIARHGWVQLICVFGLPSDGGDFPFIDNKHQCKATTAFFGQPLSSNNEIFSLNRPSNSWKHSVPASRRCYRRR